MDDEVLSRIRASWSALAATPDGFTPQAIHLGTAAESQLSPPGSIGAVRLGDAALVVAPTATLTATVRALLAGAATAAPAQDFITVIEGTDGVYARLVGAADRMLGPVALAFLDPAAFVPAPAAPPSPVTVPSVTAPSVTVPSVTVPAVAAEPVSVADATSEIDALNAAAGGDDVNEAFLADATSPLFVVRGSGGIIAACGYELWDGALAHMVILTHPEHRSRGLGTIVASAATAHAIEAGLIPQWRARPAASQAIARRLGYEQIGSQLSVRITEPAAPTEPTW